MSDDFLEGLWRATDIEPLVARLLPTGRKIRGDSEWAAPCPYCGSDEKDPRFSVDLKDGKYKCFKCNEVGNCLTLGKRLWGRLWKAEWVAACPRAADVLGAQAAPPAIKSGGGQPGPRARRSADDAWRAGKSALLASPASLDPLATAWRVDAGWLAQHGVVPVDGAFGFPSFDPASGDCVDLKRRRLPPLKEGESKSASWPGGKAGLFGFGALAAKPTAAVLVTEGEKDWCVTAHDMPKHAVVGIGMGAGCFNPSWAEALRGRDVILCYDPDEAGVAGAAKAAGYLQGVASRVRVMRPLFEAGPLNEKGKKSWPVGLDLYDYLRGKGSVEALERHLAESDDAKATFDAKQFIRDTIADLEAAGEEVDWNRVGGDAFKALVRGGARWVRIEGAIHCVFEGSVYTVTSRDLGWQRLMFVLCGRTSEEKEGRIFAKVISLNADLAAAVPEQTPAWCVRKGFAVYVSINDVSGRMVRVSPDDITVLDNGTDGVVTFPYEGARPVRLIPEAEYDHPKAMSDFDKATSYFACSEKDRLFLRWYVLTVLLYPFAQTHPVMRFRGDSAAGKSTAAKAITTILYGEPILSSATNAALYRLARRRALTAIDNLEERDFRSNPELQNFVLVSATGRAREKSARDTDNAVVREEVKSLFLSTGIEPVGTDKPEVVNRTVEIGFDAKYGTPGFYEAGYIEHLQRERDLFWNLIFRVTQDALRSIRDGNLQKSLKTMGQQKRRLGEFFALMSIAQTGGDEVNSMVKDMLAGFDVDEKDTHHDGDASVPIFRAIPASTEDLSIPTQKDGPWIRTDFLPTPDLYRVLSFVARKYSLELPWKSANAMATRLNADAAVNLKAHGVMIERRRTSSGRLIRVSIRERVDSTGQEELVW